MTTLPRTIVCICLVVIATALIYNNCTLTALVPLAGAVFVAVY
jgi:uncharacterized protein (DUF302 family)